MEGLSSSPMEEGNDLLNLGSPLQLPLDDVRARVCNASRAARSWCRFSVCQTPRQFVKQNTTRCLQDMLFESQPSLLIERKRPPAPISALLQPLVRLLGLARSATLLAGALFSGAVSAIGMALVAWLLFTRWATHSQVVFSQPLFFDYSEERVTATAWFAGVGSTGVAIGGAEGPAAGGTRCGAVGGHPPSGGCRFSVRV